jgi:hypothetical protein
VKRSDTNQWALLIVATLVANVVPVVLLLRIDTNLAVATTVLIAIALFYLSYRFTRSRLWWIVPVAGSPLLVLPLLAGLLFIGALLGIVPVP